MAAVLRVKRRHDDEPLNALVFACKRRKTAEDKETEESKEEAASTPLRTVFKFAGTVKNQGDNVVEHLIQVLEKDELKANYKQHPVDVLNKAREKAKQASAENRYKVVNCFRSLDNSNTEKFKDEVMTVIDVEDSVSCATNGEEHSKEKDESYVYDLYYGKTENEVNIDDMVSVHPFEQELVFDNYRDNAFSDVECESEDSNSESNWRNDYPDSDHSEGSIDESDMLEAVQGIKVDDNSDLSSEEDFVYAANEGDVEAHGYKYALYKARVMEELDEDDGNLSGYSEDEYGDRDEDNNSDREFND